MCQKPVQLIVVDDHPFVRLGIREALSNQAEFEVVAEADDGKTLLKLLTRRTADLLILDLEIPDGADQGLIQRVRGLCPDLKILILSAHTDARFLQVLHGADIAGYMVKDEAPSHLLQAIRVICAGESWFSHSVSEAFLKMARVQPHRPEDRLSVRELQVYELMQQALDNQTIGVKLNISKQTVRRYATIIYEKLGVKSRVQAILGGQHFKDAGRDHQYS